MTDRPSDETLREWTRILTPGQAAMARELLEAREQIAVLHALATAPAVCDDCALAEEVIEAAREVEARLRPDPEADLDTTWGILHSALARYDAGREET